MTVQQIMRNIAAENKTEFQSVSFNRQQSEKEDNGVKTKANEPWLSFWSNEPRIRVSVHEDTFKLIKENLSDASLLVKPAEVVTPTDGKASYIRYIIFRPTTTELSFTL